MHKNNNYVSFKFAALWEKLEENYRLLKNARTLKELMVQLQTA